MSTTRKLITDVEAFERAILADMDDVAVKLVYADWLEERDNPLGPCLRDVTELVTASCPEYRDWSYDPLTLLSACQLVFKKRQKLGALTDAQMTLIGQHRSAWLRVGLSSGPYDRETVRQLLREAYQSRKLAEPLLIEMPTPLHGAIAATLFDRDDRLFQPYDRLATFFSFGGRSANTIIDTVDNWDILMLELWEGIAEEYTGKPMSLGGYIESRIVTTRQAHKQKAAAEVLTILKEHASALGTSFLHNAECDLPHITTCVSATTFGTANVDWMAFYSAISAFGLYGRRNPKPLLRLQTMTGGWWGFKSAVIVVPRPKVIRVRGSKTNISSLQWPTFRVTDVYTEPYQFDDDDDYVDYSEYFGDDDDDPLH